MLEAIIVVLVVLWLLGFFAMHITTGFIHILLAVALVVFILRMMGSRPARAD